MSRRRALVLLAGLAAVATTGCNTDPLFAKEKIPTGPVTKIDAPDEHIEVPNIVVLDAGEYDLVEEVLASRAHYAKAVTALRDYYQRRGQHRKLQWAEHELADVGKIQPFKYIADGEVPAQWLTPRDSIPEADALYSRGTQLMKEGGHGIPALYSDSKMREAVKPLTELISKYPTSDKIDDAAFCLGEIYKEYFKNQEEIALEWYARAYTWDPKTPHPARFQSAVVYDYRLHDRARALELYHEVLNDETDNTSNAAFATRRIQQLTEGIQVAGPRPAELDTPRHAEGQPPPTTPDTTADASEPSTPAPRKP